MYNMPRKTTPLGEELADVQNLVQLRSYMPRLCSSMGVKPDGERSIISIYDTATRIRCNVDFLTDLDIKGNMIGNVQQIVHKGHVAFIKEWQRWALSNNPNIATDRSAIPPSATALYDHICDTNEALSDFQRLHLIVPAFFERRAPGAPPKRQGYEQEDRYGRGHTHDDLSCDM